MPKCLRDWHCGSPAAPGGKLSSLKQRRLQPFDYWNLTRRACRFLMHGCVCVTCMVQTVSPGNVWLCKPCDSTAQDVLNRVVVSGAAPTRNLKATCAEDLRECTRCGALGRGCLRGFAPDRVGRYSRPVPHPASRNRSTDIHEQWHRPESTTSALQSWLRSRDLITQIVQGLPH